VSRVSVWLNEANDTKIRCVSITENGRHPHERGTVLDRSLYPAYFRAIDRDRIVASSNPLEDDRTKELGFSLLKPENITAVLDIGVRYGTKTVGVMSIEHKTLRRDWFVDEISFATSLAEAVTNVLEQKQRQQTDKLKQAFQQLEEMNAEVLRQKQEIEETASHMKESIRYAKRIQNNILPDKSILKRELGNYFIVFRPKDIVGGDFYWFSSVDDDRRVIIVADGTGHGVPGAFLTLIGYLLMNQIVNEKGITRPDEILYHLHIGVRAALKQDEESGEVTSTSRDGMDVACVTLNMRTLECLYAGANLPLYYYQDWEVHEVRPSKKPIGGEQLEEERTYELNVIQLKPGDALYLYTDGFVDQMGGPEDKRFSKKRFRDLILRTQHESMKTQRALLNLEWKDWKDDREQLDDVTVFGLKL
jgi:serine phosphatase RsbU (regulator of sigma subunit)